MNEARIDENEIAEAAKAETEAEFREKCVKAYKELEFACQRLEDDPEAADQLAFGFAYSAWNTGYVEVAKTHLPKLHQRFTELWEKRCETEKAKPKPLPWWKRVFGRREEARGKDESHE